LKAKTAFANITMSYVYKRPTLCAICMATRITLLWGWTWVFWTNGFWKRRYARIDDEKCPCDYSYH